MGGSIACNKLLGNPFPGTLTLWKMNMFLLLFFLIGHFSSDRLVIYLLVINVKK